MEKKNIQKQKRAIESGRDRGCPGRHNHLKVVSESDVTFLSFEAMIIDCNISPSL